MYQLRVSRGPNDLCSRLSLVKLVQALCELGPKKVLHLYVLANFTKCFRQVQQVEVLKKDHENLCIF